MSAVQHCNCGCIVAGTFYTVRIKEAKHPKVYLEEMGGFSVGCIQRAVVLSREQARIEAARYPTWREVVRVRVVNQKGKRVFKIRRVNAA